MNENARNQASRFLGENVDDLTKTIIEVCSIPSPTGFERKKAEFILNRLHEVGAEEAYIDDAGNVLYPYKIGKHEKVPVYCAHIDTVFDGIEKIEPQIIDNRLYAPSSADNSANVAGLIIIIKMLHELKIELPTGIMFAFNVGEEGLGNLKGIRHIVEKWRKRISEVVAVDGSCNEFVNVAVGSKRYSVTVETEGGHSWKNFGQSNAILIAANMINALYQQNMPNDPKTTYNVGTIKGGTSINSIAGSAEFLVDLRSESQDCLTHLDEAFNAIVNDSNSSDVTVKLNLLGDRPCSNSDRQTEIQKRIINVRKDLGLTTAFHSASTDANIPLSFGIPAITFGTREGDKVHSVHEYVELDSIEGGIKQLAFFILDKSY